MNSREERKEEHTKGKSFEEIYENITKSMYERLGITCDEFKITYIELVGEVWRINIEFRHTYNNTDPVEWVAVALCSVDAQTGKVVTPEHIVTGRQWKY